MNGIKIEISGENKNNNDFHEFLRETINPRFEKTEGNLHVFMGQNYSFGTDSDLAIAVFLKFEELNYTLEIISSGGGDGVFGFTGGNEKRGINSIKNKIEKFCNEKNFEYYCTEIDI